MRKFNDYIFDYETIIVSECMLNQAEDLIC